MATSTRVASRSPLSSLSLDQIALMQQEANRTMAVPEVGIEDPRQTVQSKVDVPGMVPEQTIMPESALRQEVAAVPQLSTEAATQDVNGVPFTSDRIRSPEELAVATGSRFAGRELYEPVLDENQQPILGADGQPVLRPISFEDYENQRSIERARQLDVGEEISSLASNPYENAKSFIKNVASEQKATQFDESGRVAARSLADKDGLDSYIDRGATTIASMVDTANNYLFNNSPIKTRYEAEGKSIDLNPGLFVALEMGISPNDAAQMNTLNTIMSLSYTKSIDQTRRITGKEKTPVQKYTSGMDDGTLMLDQINAVKSYAQNAFERAGIEMNPKHVELLSKAMVYGGLYDGSLAVVQSKDGRPIVYSVGSLKDKAKKIKEVTAIVAGDETRSRSSTTPARSGGSFVNPGERLTEKSVPIKGLITEAAELNKDIMGSIGTVFRTKDVLFKQAELMLITKPEYINKDSKGNFLYSTHPLAKRVGLSESDYKTSLDKIAPPQGFNPNDFEQMSKYKEDKDKKAAEIMDMKFKTLVYAIENASKSTGVRYTSYKHSIFNQRFFPDNFDTDYMGDKTGVRDMIGLAAQDFFVSSSLFDENKVRFLQEKAVKIFKMSGEEQHKALSRLNITEVGAIGTMINAVINYHSAVKGDNPNITAEAPATLVSMYTPAIGDALADVGKQYNDFLADPESIDQNGSLFSLLVGMEKGESMGSKNLWDDFFNAKNNFKNPATRDKSIPLTHHSFDDGNQNGIFLQALFFGGESAEDAAIRLGTYNPSLDDMRVRGMTIMVSNLDDVLKDNDKARESYQSFFKEIIEKFGKETVAKDFFKVPLMQASYGKDASMFTDHMIEMILDNPNYSEYADKHLIKNKSFNTIYDAADSLSKSVENSLREIINTKDSRTMKAIGRYLSLLNVPVMIEGVSGDTSVYTPVNTQPINKFSATNAPVTRITLSNGKQVLLRQRELEKQSIETPEGTLDVANAARQFAPSYAKPMALYLNRAKNTYDEFHNVKGSAQSRSTVVGPIQSIDGDLVKWTNIYLNRDRKVPYPALWVHDSIISTPGSGLIYRNAYNNIAIPKAIPEIAKFGKKFEKLINEAEASEIKRVKDVGLPVGIGEYGEYSALGALFDELETNIDPDNTGFKDRFISRWKGKTSAYDKYIAKTKDILREAEANGWIPSSQIGLDDKKMLAVTPKQFENLIKLSGEYLKLKGPEGILKDWSNKFSSNVKSTANKLMSAAYRFNGNGIGQMTYGATGKRANVDDFLEKLDEDRTNNFISQYQRAFPEEE